MDRRYLPPLQRTDLIRNIPFPRRKTLVGRLDIDERWQKLLGYIPSHRDDTQPRYTYEDQARFERELQRRNGSPSDALLRDWQHVNPTIGDLITALQSSGLNETATYVHRDIMGAGPLRIAETGEEPRIDAAPPYSNEGSYYNVHEVSGDSAPPYSLSSSDGSSNNFRPLSSSISNSSSAPSYPPRSLLDAEVQRSLDSFKSRNGATTFNYTKLELMTNMFDEEPLSDGGRLIGKGGFGDVFLAVDKSTRDKKMLAVKRFKDESVEYLKQFKQEIQMFFLGCNHQNILKIMGICHETKFCVIYEYMPDGSLEDCLKNKSSTDVCKAKTRMKYALDVVYGIHGLHSLPEPITHRDIKSANILLNGDIAKIGDFGLARSRAAGGATTSVMTKEVIGSTFYMPPEAHSGKISSKWDVYSFGMVLAELVTGMSPSVRSDGGTGDTSQDFEHSISLVEFLFNNDDIEIENRDYVDDAAGWNIEQALKLLDLSEKCYTTKVKDRPTIKQVLMELEEIEQKYSTEPRMLPADTL